MLGDLETHDRTCRRLAAATNVRVLAVDFRRAPEYRWPAAVDDADAAVEWGNTELEEPRPYWPETAPAGTSLSSWRSACTSRAAAVEACCSPAQHRSPADERKHSGTRARLGMNVDTLRWAIAQWLPGESQPRIVALSRLVSSPPTTTLSATRATRSPEPCDWPRFKSSIAASRAWSTGSFRTSTSSHRRPRARPRADWTTPAGSSQT